MYNIKEVYKQGDTALYFIVEQGNKEARVSPEQLITLIERGKISNASIIDTSDSKVIKSTNVQAIQAEDVVEFCHVSIEPIEKTYTFKPRIPTNGAGAEDKTYPRICLSDSLQGAISAIPDGMDMIGSDPITVFRIPIAVNDPRLIDFEELYDKGLVPDAMITHECWYTTQFMAEPIQIIITGFEDDFKYLVDEADRKRIYSGIEKYTNMGETITQLIDRYDMFDFVNDIVYREEIFSPIENSLSDIMEYSDITCMQYVSRITYVEGK